MKRGVQEKGGVRTPDPPLDTPMLIVFKIYLYPLAIAILLKYSKNEIYFCLKYKILPALNKIKNCCATKFLRQSFQLRKIQNNQRYLDKSFTYHMELM